MMTHYKSLIVESGEMQSTLDHYVQEGWRLHSATAHSRKIANSDADGEKNEFAVKTATTTEYLLIFFREDRVHYDLSLAAEEEPLASPRFPLPEY